MRKLIERFFRFMGFEPIRAYPATTTIVHSQMPIVKLSYRYTLTTPGYMHFVDPALGAAKLEEAAALEFYKLIAPFISKRVRCGIGMGTDPKDLAERELVLYVAKYE